MKLAVFVKQVLDPEIPSSAFRVSPDGKQPVVEGMPASQVIDSYAENALEMGLQIRDHHPGSSLTALSVGGPESEEAIRRAFSLTADAGIRVWDEGWEGLDGLAVSELLAKAVAKMGGVDLILCGREASDVEEGVVGPAVAEMLDVPCVTLVRSLEVEEGAIRMEREVDGLVGELRAKWPLVLSVTSSDQNVPRMAKVKDRMLAKRKRIEVWGAKELGLSGPALASRSVLERLEVEEVTKDCQILEGPDALVEVFHELKVI